MVSAKCLNPELINLEFWRKIPGKFKGIRFYEDKKSKIREVKKRLNACLLFQSYHSFSLYLYFQLACIKSNGAAKAKSAPSGKSKSGQQQQQQQQEEQNEEPPKSAGVKKLTKRAKGKKKSNVQHPCPPKKKKKPVLTGETVEEEPPLDGEEECSEEPESGIQSTYGESIYEDFDNNSQLF